MRQPSRVDWLHVLMVACYIGAFLCFAYGLSPLFRPDPSPTVEAPTPNPDLTEVIAHSVRNSNDIAELKRRIEKLEASEK